MSNQCSTESILSSLDAGLSPGPQSLVSAGWPGSPCARQGGAQGPLQAYQVPGASLLIPQHPTPWYLLVGGPGPHRQEGLLPSCISPGPISTPSIPVEADSVSSALSHPSTQAFHKSLSVLKTYPERHFPIACALRRECGNLPSSSSR